MSTTEQFRIFLANELIGVVDGVHTDWPTIIGTFHPTPAFVRFRHLFDHEHETIGSREPGTWAKARDAIFSAGLQLEDVQTGKFHSGTPGTIIAGERWRSAGGLRLDFPATTYAPRIT